MIRNRTNRMLGAALILIAIGAAGACRTDKTPQLEDIARLHDEALVWDCHNDLGHRILYEGLDISKRLPGGHVDLVRLKEGHVDVQVVSLYISNFTYPGHSAWQARELLKATRDEIAAHPELVELARTGSDVERITASGRIAMPLMIEGGHAIEDDPKLLQEFYDGGVSCMTLTHNVTHGWADAAADRKLWHGINDLGREVIAEMNRLGMVIDLSHVSDETFYDVLEVTEDPVICSHSACRALSEHRRNITDEMIRALAENGGVMAVVFELHFLSPEYAQAGRELVAIHKPWFDRIPKPEDLELRIALEHFQQGIAWPMENIPTIETLLDHIDHAVRIAGVDHVGLGADMYPRTPSLVGIRGAQDYPNITLGLKRRGYSDEDIRKILGANLLRVWKAVTD